MYKHASANRFYRLVWSAVNACWVAVSEGTRGRGKSARRRTAAAVLGGLLVAGAAQASAPPPLTALPSGGQVVAGQAQVVTNGNALTVNQSSAQAILNWQSFDIGSQASVRFNQPSSSAVALNRVIGTDPSRIYGQLSSNGKVFLINQSGVMFGAGAQVNVGGLVASSLGLSDQDFLGGKYEFSASGGAGAVSNAGSIRVADGGYVALLAPTVGNSGTIVAPNGSVALAAGDRIGLDLRGDGLITVQVARSALASAIDNQGVIQADGGQVVLSASAADALARSSVNNSGLIQARGLNTDGGSVRLVGEQVHAGNIDVASRAAKGGAVAIEGGFVALDGSIDAGGARGGAVRVEASGTLSLAAATKAQGRQEQGGTIDYRAGGALVESASSSTDASGATDGGSIAVHADASVLSSGSYAARGAGGMGGRIDLSGADVRLLGAQLDASGATQGGLVRVGGAFQGGVQRPDAPDAWRYTGRWGQAAPIVSADKTFISDNSLINVSATGAQGQGGTAVVWSNRETTMLGALKARGTAAGGVVEVSSKNDLRHAGMENMDIGAGGRLLLDPKNITIGNYPTLWTYEAVLGKGYTGGKDFDVAGLQQNDGFGFGVALSADGRKLAVGTPYDDGADDMTADAGAVHLFSFSDANFSGATLQGTVGVGYSGGKNYDLGLAAPSGALFGSSVALNANADVLAVGAIGTNSVHKFSFSDSDFSNISYDYMIDGAFEPQLATSSLFGVAVALNGTGDKLAVGSLYDSAICGDTCGAVYTFTLAPGTFTYINQITAPVPTIGQQFGSAVALSADGSKLAVGAIGTNSNSGAVYLYTDPFGAKTHFSTISNSVGGGNNLNVDVGADALFGSSVAFNAAGNRLAVGSASGGDFGNPTGPGNVRIIDFSDNNLAAPTVTAVLGRDYTVGKNADVSLGNGDNFGFAVAMDGTGNHLIVGAPMSPSKNGLIDGPGNVHAFSLLPAKPTTNLNFGMSKPKPHLDSTIDAATLAATLSNGVSITLQANNDILLEANNDITVDTPGVGGSLTLQAGRSITLNSSITTDHGNLTLVANETLANGVVSANRDAGAATITLAAGETINTGTGALSMTVANGAGRTGTAQTSGALTINGALQGSTITLRNEGVTTNSNVVVAGGASVSAGGTLEVAAAGSGAISTFTNNGSVSAARYLVYSDNPANTTEGSLSGFSKHYNQTYTAGSTPAYASTGSWLFYEIAPTLNISGTAGATKVYDGLTAAPAIGFTATGYIDGDTFAIFSGNQGALAPGKNVGTYTTNIGTLAQSLGYTIGSYTPTTYTVTPKTITVDASGGGKVYNGNNAATVVLSSAGKIAGDTLNFSGSASFADKHVGIGKTVSVTGIAKSGADAANYTLSATTASVNADISARVLNAGATASNKVYDGLTDAVVTLSDDRVGGDVLTVTSSDADFDTKNVGNGKTVTVLGLGLSGADAGNYTLASSSATTSANISARTLTATASGVNRVYDGTLSATASYGSDKLAGDTVTLSGNAVFTSKDVGTGKTVNVSGIALGGADAGNYTLASTTATTSADIGARTLVVSATGNNRVYDGALGASATYASDKIGADTLSLTGTAVFADKNVGTAKTVTVTGITVGGVDAGNYVLASSTATTSADITAKTLTASATGVNKVYDGLLGASTTFGDDRIGGDVLTLSGSAAFGDKNVGTGKTVNVTGMTLGGLDAGNYVLASTTATTSANIAARTLNASATGINKVYDGLLGAQATYGDDRIGGDALILTGAAAFGDKNVGAGKTVNVTGIALGGADAGNYVLASTTATTSADIGARTLTASATAANKVYDATTGALATLGDDRVSGDVLSLSGNAQFDTKHVGTGKNVDVTGITLGGLDAGNYVLASTTATTSANITPKTLTASATGVNKVYDGLLGASANYGDDRINGDVLSVTGTAVFGDKNVGTGKTVGITGITLGGLDAGNYVLAATTATTSADIGAKTLNAGATGVSKIYDGLLGANVVYGDDRIGGDALTLSGTAAFGDKNVGSGKTVTVTGITVGGVDAGNYVLASSTATTSADITAKTLTASATGVNKVYDGLLGASTTFGDDRVGGDVLTLSGSAAFGDKNVGTGKTVNVTGIALGGLDAGNYMLASTTATTSANIAARTLNASATGINKVYDGLLGAHATYGDDRIGGDALILTGAAVFGDKNVGAGKTVNVTGIALGGADAGNYVLASTTATTSADIGARTLTASATAADKVYDATTGALATLGDDRVSGDVLSLSGNAQFDTKHAGTGKTVNVTGITLGGVDAGNYVLASNSTTTSAAIAAKTLNASASVADKVYDGTLVASATYGDDRIGGDVLSVTGTAAFGDKNVGSGKAVAITGIALGGLDAGNYVLASTTASASATISARTLNASASVGNKVYDATTGALATFGDDRLSGDLLTLSGNAQFDTKNVGTGKAVSVTGIALGGADAGNYVLATTATTSSADIAARTLNASATGVSKVYDGTLAASATYGDDRIAGDQLSVTGNASFADKNAGSGKSVTVSGITVSGADAGNYVLAATDATASADIAQRILTASAIASDKVYDGSTVATVTLSDNRIAGDVLNLATGGASFADRNVGNGKLVTAGDLSLGGADAGNYVLASTSAASTASITPKALSASLTGTTTKVYDGSSAAAINGAAVTLDGFIAGEGASVANLVGSYNSRNVSAATSVSAALGMADLNAAGGTALSNYTVPTSVDGAGAITARSVTIGGIAAAVKVFDGTTVATLSNAGSLGNLVAGESLTLNAPASVSFDNRSAGTGKLVTASGYTLGNGNGALASNYVLASSSATTSGTINQASLTVTADDKTRVQGVANPALTFSASGLVAGDSIALLDGTSASTSATTDSPVGTYAINVSGNPLNDYQIVYVNGVLAVTTPPSLFDVDDAFAAVATGFAALPSAQSNLAPDQGKDTGAALTVAVQDATNPERAGATPAGLASALPPVITPGVADQTASLRGGTEVVIKRRGVRTPAAPQ